MSKADAAVYLRAAEGIETAINGFDCFCCNQLAAHGLNAKRFTKQFAPTEKEANPSTAYLGFGHGAWGKHWYLSVDTSKAKNCRILALCFAAAMASAGDL